MNIAHLEGIISDKEE